MWANCASRSGWPSPSRVLRLAWRLNLLRLEQLAHDGVAGCVAERASTHWRQAAQALAGPAQAATSGRHCSLGRDQRQQGVPAAPGLSSSAASCARHQPGGSRSVRQIGRRTPAPPGRGRSCWAPYQLLGQQPQSHHTQQIAPPRQRRTDARVRQDADQEQQSGNEWHWCRSSRHATTPLRDREIPYLPKTNARFNYFLTDS